MRTMAISRAFFTAVCLLCALTALPAHAAQIQMLPPVTEASKGSASPSPCPSGATSSMLTWDGQNAIACADGVSASDGNIVANGSITPGAFTTGAACAPEGAVGYDLAAHTPVYCSKGLVWTGLAPALENKIISCPLQYVDPANNSWGCTATCPDGYTVTGGGFSAPGVAQFGNGHYSMPDGNNGWISNVGEILACTSGSPPCDGNPSSWAVCTRLKPTP